MPKQNIPEVSLKSTKDQILAAYNEVLSKLAEKQVVSPQEQKRQKEEEEVVTKAISHSSDTILDDLNLLKSKAIKQIDSLSEQLLGEFHKLASLREAITLEQKHLQELYQINETANTLSALLQAQAKQKEQFKLEMEQIKQDFEQQIAIKKSHWHDQYEQLERNYKEQKEQLDKSRKREEEEYIYTLELNRRKEMDKYNHKKISMEKELDELRDNLLKRETDLTAQEKTYESLKIQVDQFPDVIKEEVTNAEQLLRSQMASQYSFETQLKQQEYEGILKLNEQKINYLEDKIKKQEILIKELTEKADLAMGQVQSIACRALDTSAQRFVTMNPNSEKEKM